jgi:hypothetical protein
MGHSTCQCFKPTVAGHWRSNAVNWLWATENAREKTLLTNLAFSRNRIANQTDRYVEFMKKPPRKD